MRLGSDKPQKTTTFLVVRDGVKPDWVAIWDTVEITVGRHESQDIAIREAEVSRKHCVFRQKGGVYTVEDLGSAIGTTVNGAPIKLHELKPGDVIAVGSLRIKFGQTTSPVKPGANVRFASQLKGFTMPGTRANADGGLTMMAIDLNDSMRSGQPAQPKPALRPLAVSLDGRLEVAEARDIGDSVSGLAGSAAVRDLDASLADFAELGPPAQPLTPPPLRPSASAPHAPIAATQAATLPRAVPSGDVRVELVLEVAGPAAEVEALVAAVRGKPIQVYPLTLCVKDPRKS